MTPLETALAALDPRPAALDRDRLMFLAGQRSAARRGWLLPCLSAALASAVTLAVVLVLYHPEPPSTPTGEPAALAAGWKDPAANAAGSPVRDPAPTPTGEYILLRNRVLAAGVDALPALPPDPSSGPSPNGVLRPLVLPRDDVGIPGGSQ